MFSPGLATFKFSTITIKLFFFFSLKVRSLLILRNISK